VTSLTDFTGSRRRERDRKVMLGEGVAEDKGERERGHWKMESPASVAGGEAQLARSHAGSDLSWLVAVLLLAVAYLPFLRELVHLWRVDPYAGHGMFVPFYSAFLLWADRRRLGAVPRRRTPSGALVVVGALALLAVGWRLQSIMLQGLSLVAAVAGLVLWAHGVGRLRAAAFPVAFLVFMMPLPRPVVGAVSLELQTLAARFAGAALAIAGAPHHQYGIRIELPRITLEVAEGCNGLRFLMALVTLSAALAQASQRTLARKVALVAFAIPLAILANAGRVVAVCLAAYYVGPQAAAGMPHHTIGKGVWALALAPLVLMAVALRREGGNRAPDTSS
jgi:exosortase